MKNTRLDKDISFYLVLLLSLLFCQSALATNIWTIGDSRVDGARPLYESYRYELWKRFIANNYLVDFVGSNNDTASYPTVSGQSFDRQHDGYGGATTLDILSGIDQLANAISSPDFVLIGIGGNDLTETSQSPAQIASNISLIIDRIRFVHPNANFIVEQIARARTDIMTSELQSRLLDFQNRVGLLAAQKNTNASRVIAVNMDRGWSDSFLADQLHYNTRGASLVADRYFKVIEPLLSSNPNNPLSPNPPETPEMPLDPLPLSSVYMLLLEE